MLGFLTMPIPVICPGCKKSFRVSEKFAGRKGNCPNCKHEITVPAAVPEIKVHAPEAFGSGGKTTTGELITKPIARRTVQWNPVIATVVVGAGVLILLIAFVGGKAGIWSRWTISPALLLLSPILAVAAYAVLRDDETEPHQGKFLWYRALICGAAYAFLWGGFEYLGAYGLLTGELWTWLIILPPFVAVGGLLALATFDLDFGNGSLHFGFFALVTILLRVTAGIAWPWQ